MPESLIADLLDELEPESGEPVEDLYLRTLSALRGGAWRPLEITAVFPDERVPLLSVPPSKK